MARAFGFNIPKPQGTTGIAGRLLADLTAKYPQPDTNTPDPEGYFTMLGKLYPSGISSREITFDRGFTKESSHRILTATFGDGYEQRVRDGINTLDQNFSITLSNRIWEEIALISSYFDIIQPQSFSINLEKQTGIKVVLETYSVMVGHDDVQSISAELRRVYEP